MALRLLQLGIVFTIGFRVVPLHGIERVVIVPDIELSIRLQDPQDVTVVKGQNATLRCDATAAGDGPLRRTWIYNGNYTVTADDPRRIVQQDGSLYFPKVLGAKRANGVTGEYQCLVENDAGAAMLSSGAKLRIASMEKEFQIEPSNVNATESETVVLQCKIHSTPPADIQWEINDLPLPHSTRYVPLPSGILLITNVRYSDSGSYRCKATNMVLKKPKYSNSIRVKVSTEYDIPRPTSFLPLNVSSNVTLLLGETLNLFCPVTGWPIPKVQWRTNDSITIGNSSILQIKNVNLQNTGNYLCTGSNPGGEVTKMFSVQVQQEPKFLVTPPSKSYPSSITARLECQSEGVPKPKVYWLKNGKPLKLETRIKQQATKLLFSHTFTRDSGIYQCVAVNAAGKKWVAAEIFINASNNLPSPPQNVRCRPYDDTSVCITWSPPENFEPQAYTIYPLNSGLESTPYLTNNTYELIKPLEKNTAYKFYIRSFTREASDESETVSCKTGVEGSRDLKVELQNKTSVLLKWSKISTDINCSGTQGSYKLQWRRSGHTSFNTDKTDKMNYTLFGLLPGMTYEFKVSSTIYKMDKSPWVMYMLPLGKNTNDLEGGGELLNNTDIILAPDKLEVATITPDSIKITWSVLSDSAKFYTICYVVVKEQKDCKEGTLIKSNSNSVTIKKLTPNTEYEFKVRAHNFNEFAGPFSKSLRILLPLDVPSPVLNLKYKIINESTACVYWQAPLHKNGGKLQDYVISYTPDKNWPLEKWINFSVPIHQRKPGACGLEFEASVSTFLADLKPDRQYTVLVRATSNVGIGKPILPIVVKTRADTNDNVVDKQSDIKRNQTIGVIVGVVLALVCIVCCALCILLRWRCVKRRAIARARLAASNEYRPAVARYASHGASVQVRLERPCTADVHEVQHLVSQDRQRVPNVTPPVVPGHLDSKGHEDYPNGQANGCRPYMNGHIPNGYLCHITENPILGYPYCNGHTAVAGEPNSFEEDSNSNVQTSKFRDLHKLFENSKKSKQTKVECSPHFETGGGEADSDSCDENSLNATQLTCLDDTIITNHRRTSPIVGPNG